MTKTKEKIAGTNAPASPPSSPLGAWQARALHTITLPSGQRVRIRTAGVATLLERGDLPDDLVELALLELSAENGATGELARQLEEAQTKLDEDAGDERAKVLERIKRFGVFQRHLAISAIEQLELSPDEWEPISLTLEDSYRDLPEDDLAMVAEIVQRIRATDAKGVRIGVEPLDRWAGFRDAHGCPDEGCEGCEELIRRLSSADVGAL